MEHSKRIAREFLIQQKIGRMRISLEDLMALCKATGISAMSYSEGIPIIVQKNLEAVLVKCGFTYFCGDIVIIFYSDNLTYGEKIIIIAHELGHIRLQHTYGGTLWAEWTHAQEQEAKAFAYELLAPLAVLKKCGVKNLAQAKRLT